MGKWEQVPRGLCSFPKFLKDKKIYLLERANFRLTEENNMLKKEIAFNKITAFNTSSSELSSTDYLLDIFESPIKRVSVYGGSSDLSKFEVIGNEQSNYIYKKFNPVVVDEQDSSNNVYPTRNRLQGFTKAFEDAGIKVQPDLLAIGGFDAEYALSHARILLHRNPVPTAILAGGHGALMGISRALKENNLTMGKEIAFIALDQLPYLEVFSDNISTVYRDTEAIGREAAILILEGIEGEKPRVSVIESEFIERASSQGGL